MIDSGGKFVSRSFVLTSAALVVVALLSIGIAVFLLPGRSIRRNYKLANCTVVSAELACVSECRLATVTSQLFVGNATVELDGSGNAPCNSTAECEESFACRFRNEGGALEVREEVAAVAPGFIIFTSLAVIVICAVVAWCFHDCVRFCGADLSGNHALRLLLFFPRGVDTISLIRAITSRWPQVEARGLCYQTYIEDYERVKIEARRNFETPWAADKSGVVFCCLADGRNEASVLDAAPSGFYRVLVLPRLEDCIEAACEASEEHSENRLTHLTTLSSTANGFGPPSSPQTSVRSSPHGLLNCKSARANAKMRPGDVVASHASLVELVEVFDSVYKVGNSEVGDYSEISRRAVSPYVPLRISFVAVGIRLRTAIESVVAVVIGVLCCSPLRQTSEADD